MEGVPDFTGWALSEGREEADRRGIAVADIAVTSPGLLEGGGELYIVRQREVAPRTVTWIVAVKRDLS